MSKGTLLILISAALLLGGLLIPAEQVAFHLNPGIEDDRLGMVISGVLFLKTLLVIDGLLILAAIMSHSRVTATSGLEPYIPLWQPAPFQHNRWSNLQHYNLVVFLVLAIALALRTISLNSDLWIDEVFTLVDFIRLPVGKILTDFSSDNQHILFSLLSHASVALFGESPWAIRLPSVLFGLASIWAGMRLALVVYGKQVAAFSGLLMAVSYHHIWFSQNARGYTMLLLGTVLSTYFLLRGLQYGKWRYWAGYAVVIAFSAWAHLTAVFVALAHGVVIVLLLLKSGSNSSRKWLPIAGLALAAWLTLHLYALVLPQLLEYFTRPGAGTGLVQTEWRSPLWLFNEIFSRLGISSSLGWLGITTVLIVSGIGCYWYARHDRVFIMLVIFPGLLLGTTMLLLGRNLWPRMFFNESAFVLILIAVAALAAGDFARKRLFSTGPAILSWIPAAVLVVIFSTSLPDLYRFPKQDFTGARDYVLEQAAPGDQIVGIHIAGRIYSLYYAPEWPIADSLEELVNHLAENGHTWVLYTLPRHIDAALPDLAGVLKSEFEVLKIFPGTLGDGNIIVSRSKSKYQETLKQ